jgi:Calcium binding
MTHIKQQHYDGKEIQCIIDYEIVVDCYDKDEVKMGWYYFMSESIEFPFTEIHTVKMASDATSG